MASRGAKTSRLSARLVSQSLSVVDSERGGERRYRFLETISEYARERLFQTGATDRLRGATFHDLLRAVSRGTAHPSRPRPSSVAPATADRAGERPDGVRLCSDHFRPWREGRRARRRDVAGQKGVPDALRAAGVEIRVHDELFPQGTEDVVWLREAGLNGWIVITRDDGIRYNQLEKRAVIAARRRFFSITSSSLTGEAAATLILSALDRMSRLCRQHSKRGASQRLHAARMRIPNSWSSPWMRGAPHSGFAMDISRINARTSAGTPGRLVRCRLFHVQNRRKPADAIRGRSLAAQRGGTSASRAIAATARARAFALPTSNEDADGAIGGPRRAGVEGRRSPSTAMRGTERKIAAIQATKGRSTSRVETIGERP